MAKTVVVQWDTFFNRKHISPVTPSNSIVLALAGAIPSSVNNPFSEQVAPVISSVDGNGTWSNVFQVVLTVADWMDVGIIIFAGFKWMFGDRTKALEFLIGGAIGYLIIRHSVDIMHWLRGL